MIIPLLMIWTALMIFCDAQTVALTLPWRVITPVVYAGTYPRSQVRCQLALSVAAGTDDPVT